MSNVNVFLSNFHMFPALADVASPSSVTSPTSYGAGRTFLDRINNFSAIHI